jgi:isopenicillin N synthase-like dioxygenase
MIADSIQESGLVRIFHYFQTQEKLRGSTYGSQVRLDDELTSCNSEKTTLGSSPHTDWGLFTAIITNDLSGLEFYDIETKSWAEIHLPEGLSVKDVVVVNGGDFLRLATNCRYQSPIHRVLSSNFNPSKKNRVAFVYFSYPPINMTIHIQHKTQQKKQDPNVDDHELEVLTDCLASCSPEIPFEYNTLLKGVKINNSNISFGDYIMKKWKGVSQ